MKKEPQKEDEHLTPDDISKIIENLSSEDHLRISTSAKRLSYGGIEADDLIQDAILLTLQGDRKCPKDVKFTVFIVNAMKSIASNQRKKKTTENACDSSEQSLEGLPKDQHLINNITPEAEILKCDVMSLIDQVISLFDNTELDQEVLIGRLCGDSPKTIQEGLSLSSNDYRTVNKRITRKIHKKYPQGWPL